MKRFMYFSVGVLCLAVAVLIGFHLGARNADAQPSPVLASHIIKDPLSSSGIVYVMILENGELYTRRQINPIVPGLDELVYAGNFWNGGAVGTAPSTIGGVKSKYR